MFWSTKIVKFAGNTLSAISSEGIYVLHCRYILLKEFYFQDRNLQISPVGQKLLILKGIMVKIGDRVRFLNSVGGGIVKKFQNKDIALVEEEDGFETPVLIRECVLVESVSNETNMPEIKKQAAASPSAQIIIRQEIELEEEIEYEETPEGEKLTVSLAFLPQDVKQLQTTAYDAYLVNDSNYFLHYVISTLSFDSTCQSQGLIEPNTKFHFTSISKEELNDWEKIGVQLLAFKKKPFAPKPAVDVELKVNPVKFYKLHSFTSNDYFRQDALMVSVIKNDGFTQEITIDPQLLKEQLGAKQDDKPRRSRIERKAVQSNGIIEIDLHIDELLDSTAGMSNGEMLQYQLEKFNEVLRDNKTTKGQKIVFIHGKGEGVLRTEILKQLKSKYSNYYVQDASFREYGFGATMVTIK